MKLFLYKVSFAWCKLFNNKEENKVEQKKSMRKSPMQGEIYRHFKDKLYQIVGFATHSETGEKLVIYQALYGEFGMCARPYDMFMSEVDHVKYPDVKQKYRFEKVGMAGAMNFEPSKDILEKPSEVFVDTSNSNLDSEKESNESQVAEELPNPDLLAFLDAETFNEKYKLLVAMRPRITDRLINDFAASLDITVEEGDLESRFRSLLYCVKKMDEFEVTRLR